VNGDLRRLVRLPVHLARLLRKLIATHLQEFDLELALDQARSRAGAPLGELDR
jgi:hypothetical protein